MFNKGTSYSKKHNRIKNAELLDRIRKQSCVLIGYAIGENKCFGNTDPHHIKSVGSGGHDIETNVMPLCRKHHSEIHMGLNKFSAKYSVISIWLSRNGWSFNSANNKWSSK